MTDIFDNTKNLYAIKHKLSELKKTNGHHFQYYVGGFLIQIFTDRIQENSSPPDDCITLHQIVDINLSERVRLSGEDMPSFSYDIVDLTRDSRFRDYLPIKYTDPIALSNGREMPIMILCELIKYLHRLSNLSAFT